MDSNEMITLLSQILDERIGMVTAYAYAKSKGYSGSADDFANDMANIGVNISAIETAINTFNNQTVPNAETAITTAGSNQVTAVNTAGQEQLQNVTAEGGRQVGLVAAAGTAQTEAVNTAGTTQTNAVNTAGSTQVSNVNSAGSQQITAIQQKGEETRQSIPADYTNLTNEVNDLKSANIGLIKIESGTFADADGKTKTVSARRARNANPIIARPVKSVAMPSGYNMWWFALDSEMNLLNNTSTWVNELDFSTLPNGTAYVNFAVRNQSTPTADITSEIPTIQSGTTIEYLYDATTELTQEVSGLTDSVDYLQNAIDENIVITGTSPSTANTFEQSMLMSGFWIGADGNLNANAASKYARIPVDENAKYEICYNVSYPNLANSSALGAYLLEDADGNRTTVLAENLQNGSPKNGYNSKIITIPSGIKYFLITIKLATSWDVSGTFTFYKYEDVTTISKIADSEINDSRINSVIYFDYGENRNPNNDINGYLTNNGNFAIYSDWKTVDFCYVGDCETVINSARGINGTGRSAVVLFFLCTYDEDKNFIEQVSSPTSTYTVGENVKYIRYCYHSDSVTDVMLQSGTTVSAEFVPYAEPTIKLKHDAVEEVLKWSGLKWACVGDSLTEYNARTDKHYFDYVRDKTGIEVVNMGRSGTGYKRTEDEGYAFYQRISNVPLDTDVVTIFGSGNDLSLIANLGTPTDTSTDTICGCINTTIDNLYAILPTVQLGIVTPSPWGSSDPADETNNMTRYANAIKQICYNRGIPCLDLYHCSNMRPWDTSYRTLCYSKDGGSGTHPDETGHKIMSSHFMAFLEKLISTY